MNIAAQDLKTGLLSVLTHDGIKQEVSGRAKEIGAQIRRLNPPHPVLLIGTATCCLGAGAGRTLEAIRDFLKRHAVEAEVVETGCV